MSKLPTAVIYDVGKTNKKVFLFDGQYKILQEFQEQIAETRDDDGDACEDVFKLRDWILHSLNSILDLDTIEVCAINFCAYGASLVHLDSNFQPVAPLYNYLKPYPEQLSKEFYSSYGGWEALSVQTASPILGSLNSGMQMYRIKKEKPDLFKNIRYSMHLPQWISSLVSGKCYSDLTSIGCHTHLWDFEKHRYHEWVYREGIIGKLAPITASDHADIIPFKDRHVAVGVGVHDSSAALIPYLECFQDPFILISTGTWCISLNPFSKKPLSFSELQEDCLSYISFQGQPVKASRIFAGYHHEQETRRIAAHFNISQEFYLEILPDSEAYRNGNTHDGQVWLTGEPGFKPGDLNDFKTPELAYLHLMRDIIVRQKKALELVMDEEQIGRLYVDGGFGNNRVYMQMLSDAFPQMEVFAATVPQAAALGAAMAIHYAWNDQPLRNDIVDLRYFPPNN